MSPLTLREKTMIITHHREKLINAIIYFARNTKKCGKTKLMKLLFFLDFMHFKQTGKSVTGLDYYAWDMGPVPKTLFDEISGDMGEDLKEAIAIQPIDRFQKIVPKKKFDGKHFTARETKLLEQVAFVFKEADANQMKETSHLKNEPWDRTKREKGMLAKIDYMLAIDGMDDSLSSEDATERKQDIDEIYRIFGTIDA